MKMPWKLQGLKSSQILWDYGTPIDTKIGVFREKSGSLMASLRFFYSAINDNKV